MIEIINIPKVIFPVGIENAISEYTQNGDTLSYISEVGIDEPKLIPIGFLPSIIRLYASIKYFEENPENGLAAINIAHAFDDMGEREKAIDVLNSIERAGLPGLNIDNIDEDPLFILGFWLADYNRPTDSLIYYKRCLERQNKSNHGVIYSHIGTVYHDIKEFKRAIENYNKAKNLFIEFVNDHNNEQKLVLDYLVDLALKNKPLNIKRWYHGISNLY